MSRYTGRKRRMLTATRIILILMLAAAVMWAVNLLTLPARGTTMKWEDDGAWRGECSMRNTGESPNVAVESRLSQILEATPHGKYCLTSKACQGLLRRAERRGKALPPMLKSVLLTQSESEGAVTEEAREP